MKWPTPANLGIQLRLNGRTMQDSRTRQFIFPVGGPGELRLGRVYAQPGRSAFHRHALRRGFRPEAARLFASQATCWKWRSSGLGVLRNPVIHSLQNRD